MSGFLDYIDNHRLELEVEANRLHSHFFGSFRVQRRGRLKWKIGITRQIIKQRRRRGENMNPVDAYLLPLKRYKVLYEIRRPVRLWHYMYLALRFRRRGSVVGTGGIDVMGTTKRLFCDFGRLTQYLRKQQGMEFPAHHAALLAQHSSSRSSSSRHRIPQVEELETERLSAVAMEGVTAAVLEHAVSNKHGLVSSCIQGYVHDVVEHAVDEFIEYYFALALEIVDQPDVFLTMDGVRASLGASASAATTSTLGAAVSKAAVLRRKEEEEKRAAGGDDSDEVDASVVEKYASQYDSEHYQHEEHVEEDEGLQGDSVSVRSVHSERSYLISSHAKAHPNVLLPLGSSGRSREEEEEEEEQQLILERENEALRRMLRALAVNPEQAPKDEEEEKEEKEKNEDNNKKGDKPYLKGKKVTIDLSATTEMTLQELDAYLNAASDRQHAQQQQQGGEENGADAMIEDGASVITELQSFRADHPHASTPPHPAAAAAAAAMGAAALSPTNIEATDKAATEAEAKNKQQQGKPAASALAGVRRPKKITWEEKEAERRRELKRVRGIMLLHKAEDIMQRIEEEEAKKTGTYVKPKRERLLSDTRNLPEADLIATTRVAKSVITEVRAKLSAGNPEVVNASLGLTERKLLESPFGTPFARKYAEKVEKAERERKKAELMAVVNGKKKP
jgi:hypothetical protein